MASDHDQTADLPPIIPLTKWTLVLRPYNNLCHVRTAWSQGYEPPCFARRAARF
jgi:hypothetical protein